MKKKLDIKRIILTILYCSGTILLLFWGVVSVRGFVFSVIPFVLVYILSLFWYGKKRANTYGIVFLLLLSTCFIIGFIILPLLNK